MNEDICAERRSVTLLQNAINDRFVFKGFFYFGFFNFFLLELQRHSLHVFVVVTPLKMYTLPRHQLSFLCPRPIIFIISDLVPLIR